MDDKDFEMPDLKKDEEEVEQNNNQEKIEIPQAYYDKLEKEKEERLQALAKKEEEKNSTGQGGNIVILIILSFIVCFGLLYGMLHVNKLLIIGIPIYVVLGSLIGGATKKENSKFAPSVLISCMLGALVCFIIAMSKKNMADKFIYYAYAFFVVAFAGYVLAMAIAKLFFDKEVKAMGKILCIIVIAALFGVPYYLYTNYKADFMSIVFNEKSVIGATTEEEYIERTLKNRYNYAFTCSKKGKKNYIDDITHRRVSVIKCDSEEANIKLEVMSLYYDEDNKQYIVRDSYLDDSYINPLKKELEESIKSIADSKYVNIGFYPDTMCYFIGDCENDKDYEKEMNLDNLHKYSDELRLKEYVGIDKVEFFNKYKFNYNILLRGSFATTQNFELMVDKITDLLEEKGLKNTNGFTITIRDTTVIEDVFKVTGKADSSGSFSNYEIVNG